MRATRASVITRWGDVYQGRRISWDESGRSFPLQYLVTSGLCWKQDRLYWTFRDIYNVTGRNDWHLGMTRRFLQPEHQARYSEARLQAVREFVATSNAFAVNRLAVNVSDSALARTRTPHPLWEKVLPRIIRCDAPSR